MPRAHLFELWVQWYVKVLSSPLRKPHQILCIYSTVIGEALISYKTLKDCSSAPVFNTDPVDAETTGSSPHSSPCFQVTEGLPPLTEKTTSSEGSNQDGQHINKHNINLNISN